MALLIFSQTTSLHSLV